MSFLPQSYEPPQTGNYMRLQTGDNRFRTLGPAIVGNMYWVTENGAKRPVRHRTDEPIDPLELPVDQAGKRERIQHFWAFPVWNRASNQVQILELTQSTIQGPIRTLAESSDWGDPTDYDIIVTKKGSGMDTEYNVIPAPKTPTPAEAVAEYQRINPNLDALFTGGDPFASTAKPTSNGHAASTVAASKTQVDAATQWAWSDAVRFAAEYELTAAQLKEELKKLGHDKWNPSLKSVVEDICIPF